MLCKNFKFVDSWKDFSRIDKLEIILVEIFVSPIQDWLFRGCSMMGEAAKKLPPL